LYPLVALAAIAAVIASQAIISGAFSLTRQAVQLGYLPRVEIVHTSATEIGQIYIPIVNWVLMLATVGLVIGFRNSSNVASAYGVALTTTMLITTLLAFLAARRIWRWPLWLALLVTTLFLIPDLAFFAAAMVKVPDGGWFPLALAAVVLAVMTTWYAGRKRLAAALDGRLLPLESLMRDIEKGTVWRVGGTAVFLTGDSNGTPIALLHNLKLNRIVHERNLFVTVKMEEIPHVPDAERLEVRDLGAGFHRLVIRYGFMEDPDVPAVLERAREFGIELDPMTTTFVLSRNLVIAGARSTFSRWRRQLFIALSRNGLAAEKFFRLPTNQVMEIGLQVEI
jgi:KUP system potassium uptake protein